jgi:enoyl-CoA hydratase/carnithine racemase
VMVGEGEVRAATLQGAGTAFSAGADLRERAAMDADAMSAHSRLIAACCDRVAELPCPTVACVNGAALGGGFELILACDLRVIAADATLGFPELTFGFFPGAGGPVRLVRLVGVSTATYLLMSTARIRGDEAVRLHIGHELAPPHEADEKGFDLAKKVASFPARGVRALRELLAGFDNDRVAEAMARARAVRDELNEDKAVHDAVASFRTMHSSAGGMSP